MNDRLAGATCRWSGILGSSLATIDIDTLLGPGNYWLSVIGTNNPDDNESIGVAISGTGLAQFTNPGGGFGIPENVVATGANAAYALIGAPVPESATWAMMIAGFGVVGGSLRRDG